MNAVCTEQNAVAGVDWHLIDMDNRRERAAQRLGDTAAQAEVAKLDIRQLAGQHGLVDTQRILFADDLILHQPCQQSIVVGQAFERLVLAQQVDTAVSDMGINHRIAPEGCFAAKGGKSDGGSQIIGSSPLRSFSTYPFIDGLDDLLQDSAYIDIVAALQICLDSPPLLHLLQRLFPAVARSPCCRLRCDFTGGAAPNAIEDRDEATAFINNEAIFISLRMPFAGDTLSCIGKWK